MLDDGWLRGMTLGERTRFLRRGRVEQRAESDYEAWLLANCRGWFASAGPHQMSWVEFLKAQKLAEETLCGWASRLDQLRHPPGWLGTLERLLCFLADDEGRVRGGASVEKTLGGVFLRFARSEQAPETVSLLSRRLSPSAIGSLESLLSTQLMASGASVLDWEKKLAGEFFRPAIAVRLILLLRTYPGLARLWMRQVEHWVAFVRDFVIHFEAARRGEWRERASVRIRCLTTGWSDPHHGNRVVLSVRLDDRSVWFYKPRSARPEAGWFDLIRWLNALQSPERFKTLRVFGDDQHCWMEAARARLPRGRGQVQRLFRTGMLPLANGEWPTRGDLSEPFCDGFAAMHHFLSKPKIARQFASEAERQLAPTTRLILRPSAYYDLVRRESYAPRLMTNGLERSVFLHAAFREGRHRAYVADEVEALEEGDIPRLEASCGASRGC